MSNSNKKPILVTGSHRSGSSWIGSMLALPSNVAYLDEPFKLRDGPDICKAKFEYWFPYICNQNESLYFNDLEATFKYKYNLKQKINSIKDIILVLRDYSKSIEHRLFSKRPLVKDPIAIFSAEWLARRFNMDVVVSIRHPAAFAGSLKKANWPHPFSHFLMQPLLMGDYLDKYRSEIEEYSNTEKDIVDQAILLWNLIHHVILIYQENNPSWFFVRHEDLSRNPIEEFAKLYSSLELEFSQDIQQKIKRFSSPEPNNKNDSIKRDSKSNILEWKTRLTIDEIEKIKEKTHEIASKFYTEEDWSG